MARTTGEWAVIRKAESEGPDSAEQRLSDLLNEKFREMGLEMVQDRAIELLTGGQLDALMQLLDAFAATKDIAVIGKIIAEQSRAAGMEQMNEAFRALQAAGAAQQPVPAAVTPAQTPMVRRPTPRDARAATVRLPMQGQVGIAFDALDKNVIAWAEARAANLVVQITENMRETIRAFIVEAVQGSATAAETARKLARIIPLHSRYARAVINRERTLFDSYVKGGMDATKARAKAAEMADKYAAKLTKLRSRTIARTEIMTASNHGQYIGQQTAMNSGLMRPSMPGTFLVTKEWVTAEDEMVCPVCGGLNKQQVGFEELFEGGFNHPPAHPNCRCSYNIIDNVDQFDLGHGDVF